MLFVFRVIILIILGITVDINSKPNIMNFVNFIKVDNSLVEQMIKLVCKIIIIIDIDIVGETFDSIVVEVNIVTTFGGIVNFAI